jgi:hypothetical protein
MARTLIPVVDTSKAGTTMPAEVAADVANGNYVPNDGKTLVLARNANGASTARTVTITLVGTIDGFAPAARTISIPAGASKILGPYEVVNYGSQLQLSGDNAELKFTPIRVP